MKAKSYWPASPLASLASSVSRAGAMTSSMRASTPAARQWRRATAVYSSLTSSASRRASSGIASITARLE
jgi:hypothetical protein